MNLTATFQFLSLISGLFVTSECAICVGVECKDYATRRGLTLGGVADSVAKTVTHTQAGLDSRLQNWLKLVQEIGH